MNNGPLPQQASKSSLEDSYRNQNKPGINNRFRSFVNDIKKDFPTMDEFIQ